MFYFILTLLFAAAAAFCMFGAARGGWPRWVAAIPVGLWLVFTVLLSFTPVEARSVAVQTSFGRYDDTLSGGPHMIAPWAETESFSTTIQTVDLADEYRAEEVKDGGKVQVAFAGGGQGWVNATVRWAVTEQSVEKLWQRYRSFESAESSLIVKASKDAIINVANDYTPNQARADQAKLAVAMRDAVMEATNEYGVQVDSVSILSIPLDEKTQGSLDAIVAATNNVERAKQEQERSRIDAETAKIRESSGSLSPSALTRYCLEVVNGWNQANNGPLPATLNCALAASPPVIVGQR